MCSCRERPAARTFPQVDRDDPRGGEGFQYLNGDVAESADSDHHNRRTWRESRQLTLDRAVGRQRSIGQRRGMRRIEVPDRNEQPR